MTVHGNSSLDLKIGTMTSHICNFQEGSQMHGDGDHYLLRENV